MKTAVRSSLALTAFAAILTLSSLNEAAAIVTSPVLGGAFRPAPVSEILKDKWNLDNPVLNTKKKSKTADSYTHALKVARILAASA